MGDALPDRTDHPAWAQLVCLRVSGGLVALRLPRAIVWVEWGAVRRWLRRGRALRQLVKVGSASKIHLPPGCSQAQGTAMNLGEVVIMPLRKVCPSRRRLQGNGDNWCEIWSFPFLSASKAWNLGQARFVISVAAVGWMAGWVKNPLVRAWVEIVALSDHPLQHHAAPRLLYRPRSLAHHLPDLHGVPLWSRRCRCLNYFAGALATELLVHTGLNRGLVVFCL
jgi:hypothetical protein